MYVTLGASFNPKLNPKMVNIKQINGNEWLNPSVIQPIANGIFSSKIVFRLPIRSLIGPLSKLPIGCAKCENVAEIEVISLELKPIKKAVKVIVTNTTTMLVKL